MHLPAGTQVFAENQPCQGFPLLLDGSIKVIKLAASGRELMLYRVAPGGSCIISSSCLLGHTDYNARGIAETPLTLLALPVRDFAALMVDHPPFRDFVFRAYGSRISSLLMLIDEVAFGRMDRRLAACLLARAKGSGVVTATHQELAVELGSAREVVSRLLKEFERRGWVVLSRGSVGLTNEAALSDN